MGIKKALKWLFTNPNSPEGLRMRADRLMEKFGYSVQHPYVSALLKQADILEEEAEKK